MDLTEGNLYRLQSRRLPYGVYNGRGGFIGIREKFGELFLFTELDWDKNGTARVLEDLGASPAGVEPTERIDGAQNKPLYNFLVIAEAFHGRGEGYGGRPVDEIRTSGAQPAASKGDRKP